MSAPSRRHLRDTGVALLAFVLAPVPFVLLQHADGGPVHLGFAGVPHEWGQAVAILAINAFHLWLPLLLFAGLVQACWLLRREIWRRRCTRAFDLGAALLVAYVWALPVGTTVGAFGVRMLREMLPAGPIELAAYVLAMSVYLRARTERILYRHDDGARLRRTECVHAAGMALVSGVLLGLAALVETFV